LVLADRVRVLRCLEQGWDCRWTDAHQFGRGPITPCAFCIAQLSDERLYVVTVYRPLSAALKKLQQPRAVDRKPGRLKSHLIRSA
jgi:hypothetical protein